MSKLHNQENLIFLLFALIPLFLITGPFLSDLAVSLSCLFIFFYLREINSQNYFKNIFFYIFIIFWIILILSSLISDHILNSIKSSVFYFRYIIFTIFVSFLISLDKDKLSNYSFNILFYCFLILFIFGIYELINNLEEFLAIEKFDNPRLTSLFFSEKVLGSYCVRLLPIFLGLYYFRLHYNLKTDKKKLFIVFPVVFLILLSAERSSFFYLIIFLILTFLLIRTHRKYINLIFISSLIFFVLLLSFNNGIKKRLVDETIRQIGIGQENKFIFSVQHQSHYLTGIKMFKNNILFGVGPKNFRIECKNEKYSVPFIRKSDYPERDEIYDNACSTHPHNTYIQILSETGLLTFAILITFWIFVSCMMIRIFILNYTKQKNKNPDYLSFFLIAVFINFFPFSPTGNFFNNWISIFYYLPMPYLMFFFLNISKNKKLTAIPASIESSMDKG